MAPGCPAGCAGVGGLQRVGTGSRCSEAKHGQAGGAGRLAACGHPGGRAGFIQGVGYLRPRLCRCQLLHLALSLKAVCPRTRETKEFPQGGCWRGQGDRERHASMKSCCTEVKCGGEQARPAWVRIRPLPGALGQLSEPPWGSLSSSVRWG